MLSINDLSPAEQYVLKELDPEAMLVKLPAGWTSNGTEDERRRAVPELRRGDRMSLLTLAVTDAGLTLWLMPGGAP